MSRLSNYIFFLIFINVLLLVNSDFNEDELLTRDLPPKGFGKFIVKIRHIEECKNPGTIDKKNKFNYVVRTDEYNETTENLAGYMYSPNKVKITMGKITPYIRKNGVMKVTYNITTTSPCKDPVLNIPLKTILHSNGLCAVNRGNYTIRNINIDQMVRGVVGNSFLFERIFVYYEYLSKWGSLMCLYLIIDTKPYPK